MLQACTSYPALLNENLTGGLQRLLSFTDGTINLLNIADSRIRLIQCLHAKRILESFTIDQGAVESKYE